MEKPKINTVFEPKRLLGVWLFPVVLCYFESLFCLTTTGGFFQITTLYTYLFSLAYGGVLYLLTTLFKKPIINRVITAVLLFALAVVFLIEYFVFYQFRVFYDLTTMVGGATNAVDGYLRDVFLMIFTVRGFTTILLFFLPAALYLFFSGRRFPILCAPSSLPLRLITLGAAIVLYVTGVLSVMSSSVYAPIYTKEYNYQTAVEDFGLMTAMRLNVKELMFGGDLSFETPQSILPETTEPATEQEETVVTEPTEAAPVECGYNRVEIDFEALRSSASSVHASLDEYVSSLTASKKNEYTGLFEGKNLIQFSAEAFCAEVIDPELTPTLYRLVTKGMQFTDFYQPASAGTTGGEYQNLFGMLPTAGGMSVKNTADNLNYYTMGSQLDRLGYYGKAYHNNSYRYYDRHLTHNNLGYSDGYMGYGNGMEEYVADLWPQSDLEMVQGTLPSYIDQQPFNVYYMTVSGHSGYSVSGNAMTKKHWDKVQDLPYSDTVKGYIAANLELEAALSYLVSELEARGIADDTVICLMADHFPYGLDSDSGLGAMPYLSELYGENVDNYFERDRSVLILWSGCLEDEDPIVVDTPVFSLDVLPTLSNLFGTEFDSRFMVGRDVFSDAPALVFNSNYDWKTEYGTYYASSGTFEPTDPSVTLPEGYVESVKTIVRNKMQYSAGVLDSDYLRHVFGGEETE